MSKSRSDILSLRESFRKASFFEKWALCLSAWFGTGLLPGAPGTFGTLAALPLLIALDHWGGVSGEGFKIIFVPLAIWSSHLSHKLLKRDDPSEVVIDEVAGILWTFFLLPLSWLTLCVGFILFRIFDIFKPFPIRTLERRLRGGIGIVLDDLLAGIYANLCLRIFLLFFK